MEANVASHGSPWRRRHPVGGPPLSEETSPPESPNSGEVSATGSDKLEQIKLRASIALSGLKVRAQQVDQDYRVVERATNALGSVVSWWDRWSTSQTTSDNSEHGATLPDDTAAGVEPNGSESDWASPTGPGRDAREGEEFYPADFAPFTKMEEDKASGERREFQLKSSALDVARDNDKSREEVKRAALLALSLAQAQEDEAVGSGAGRR